MGIYLDNAATSYPKPEAVYRAVDDCLRNVGASSGRGAYRRALAADQLVYRARRSLARLFNVRDVSRIVFTGNGVPLFTGEYAHLKEPLLEIVAALGL